jgi:hypothetical protein
MGSSMQIAEIAPAGSGRRELCAPFGTAVETSDDLIDLREAPSRG